MQADDDLVVDLCLEFLEAFIHQTLYQREIYSPSLFERRRLYGIAIRRARHPELVQYIQEIVANLKTPLRQNTLAKVALVVCAPETHQGQTLERFIIEPKLLLPPSPSTSSAASRLASNLDILEFEAQLRAILLKLQYIDAALPPKPPVGSTFQVVAYTAGRGGMAVDAWIEEQPPLSEQGLEMKEKNSGVGDDDGHGGSGTVGGEIVPIKSCRIEGALQLQVYVERPP